MVLALKSNVKILTKIHDVVFFIEMLGFYDVVKLTRSILMKFSCFWNGEP